MVVSRVCRLCALVVLAGMLAGCAVANIRQGSADPSVTAEAMVSGIPGARAWADVVPRDINAEVRRIAPNLPRLAQSARRTQDGRPIVEILALSGGGGDGAFGAGLLKGWTERGTRPEFEVVTGVSAGAIIAPFAYLGPRYDDQLEEIWTQYQTNQIVVTQLVPGILGGSALADTSPLQKLIEKYVDGPFLAAVARQYRRGRLLLILTTNLDAQRPVVWNMGEIAASRSANAPELFRKIILASAAIPGALPPVHIDVVSRGQTFEEMHVDGGTTREVFVSPVQAPFRELDKLYPAPPLRRIYIVKNGKIAPEPEVVQAQTIPIATRAIYTLIKAQNLGEIYAIWRRARDGGAEFNFVAVPATFDVKASEFFDPAYQRALFEEGRQLGRGGIPWLKQPPEIRR
jgi:predicted acylesterase/phospholipase RssA